VRLLIVAVGEKPPAWVREGYADYARRLPRPYTPELIEIALGHRGKGADVARAIADEGARVLAALPRQALVVALDERGASWSSVDLSRRLGQWSQEGRDVAFVIGGPDGHAPAVRERAALVWSLSALTLPHGLVRVLLAEQCYRAWSLLQNHPYHRA
jgi:23S rRNA (pseudouridine1915-N3)-methyltransferase